MATGTPGMGEARCLPGGGGRLRRPASPRAKAR